MDKHGRLPAPGHVEESLEFVDLTRQLNDALPSTEFKVLSQDITDQQALLQKLAWSSQGNLSPVAAFFGGIVGQEVLKACSGKFTPIRQWLYYDFAEALPNEPLPVAELQPQNTRYDGQIVVYGSAFQAKLSALHLFLVGAGKRVQNGKVVAG